MKIATCLAPRIVVYGHIGFDTDVVTGRQLTSVGGAAYHVALAASIFSSSVGIVSVIGDDFPLPSLTSLQVDLTGVRQCTGSSARFLQVYDDEGTVVEFAGQLNVCEMLTPALIPASYAEADFFYVATAPPQQQCAVLCWLEECGFAGRVAIDTCREYMEEFKVVLAEHRRIISVLFLNELEFRSMKKADLAGLRVVVKRGSRGVRFCETGEWVDLSAPSAKRVVSTTGAGDILAGATLSRLVSGAPLREALLEGVKMATLSVSTVGTEHLLDAYDKRMAFK